MRIFHTSDWHLGKKLFTLDRSQEHGMFLNWLIQQMKEEKVDILIIAGDIFDSPSPPHSALEMFYNFIHQVAEETNVIILVIAGNHDSAALLEAPKRILYKHRVMIWGKLDQNPSSHWVRLKKNGSEINFCAIPFFRSYELNHAKGEGVLEKLSTYLKAGPQGEKVLIMHHLSGIYEAAGSEQVISLSGIDSLPIDLFDSFTYVALGHIHKPQKIADQIYYSGSPIPLRFSESNQKSIMSIMLEPEKIPKIKKVSIPIFRQVLSLKLTEENWEEKIQTLRSEGDLIPVIEIQIKLLGPRPELLERIKKVLSNQTMDLLSYLPFYQNENDLIIEAKPPYQKSPIEIFQDFYLLKYPESNGAPEDLLDDFKQLLEKTQNASN